MSRTRPLQDALTSLDVAFADLLDGQAPVQPISMRLDRASGHIAAEMPALNMRLPARNRAALDGWALNSLDLVGASSYSPVPLSRRPQWVEAGEALPEGCDCILRRDLVEHHGPLMQALAEANPGQDVRRAGGDIAVGRPPVLAGRRFCAADLLALRATGSDAVMVRAPVLSLIDLAPSDGVGLTTGFIAALAREAGARVMTGTVARDVPAITTALARAGGDLVVLVGGTGAGRTDCAARALAKAGTLIAHGLALRPGETTAAARCGAVPVVALPGLPGHAIAGYLLLVQPLIDRLSARLPRQGMALPLSRKIASAVGVAEIALLRREADMWQVLAVGDFSLDHIRMADAWLAVAGDSEGYPAGTSVEAFSLRAT
ncbi:MAG: molybdopterin-binding protein [Parvibaculaceae bacterium]